MGGGGAERQLAYLAAPLIARGWDVHVALVTGGPNLSRLEASGAVIHRLRALTSYDPRLPWQLARLIRRVRPDVVQVWFVQMEVSAGAVSTLLGVPWILSERSSMMAYPRTWKNTLRLAIAKYAAAIVSNSQGGDAYWQDRGAPGVLHFVIPNALPLDEIDQARPGVPAGLAVRPDVAVAISIGRFDREKNLDAVFAAFREVVARPNTVAILCGNGPLRPELCRRIADAGLADRILAPGYVAGIWPLLKRAHVVVAASAFEGRPNAVLEAMAAGRPLVVSDIPAHREILGEASALWVDPDDPAAIAAAVIDVLSDTAAANRRAAAARATATQWSLAAAAAEYDSVYRRVVSRHRTLPDAPSS